MLGDFPGIALAAWGAGAIPIGHLEKALVQRLLVWFEEPVEKGHFFGHLDYVGLAGC